MIEGGIAGVLQEVNSRLQQKVDDFRAINTALIKQNEELQQQIAKLESNQSQASLNVAVELEQENIRLKQKMLAMKNRLNAAEAYRKWKHEQDG